MDKRILLCKPEVAGTELKYINEALADDWITPLGPHVDRFEAKLEQQLSTDGQPVHVCALSAGTAAIHIGLDLLGVRPGDEVICSSFTFAASANPIVYLGAKPVFVDSEPSTWNMSPELLRMAIEDRITHTGHSPRAIVVAELYGMPAKMDEIMDIAREYRIPVLEDSAEALGSCYKGRPCGTLADVGTLSFNGNKMITTSGGGAVVCHTEEMKKRALFLATQAREPMPYYHHRVIGYNYRLSNISAAVGLGQMEILARHLDHHRMLHGRYMDLLPSIPGITVFNNPSADFDSNFWLTTIIVAPDSGVTADELRVHMASLNVETRLLWKPLHLQPVFSEATRYVDGTSEHLFAQGLCLPSGPCVSIEEQDFIARAIADFAASRRK
jgi:putative perosamine synthetase